MRSAKEEYDDWFAQHLNVDPLEEMYSLDWDYFQRIKKLISQRNKNEK